MKFINKRNNFEMFAHIKEFKGASVSVLIQLFKNREEIFKETHDTSADMELYCSACGQEVFNKDNLTVRVENFLPHEEGGLILIKLKTRCVCKRRRYKRVLLSGKHFSALV